MKKDIILLFALLMTGFHLNAQLFEKKELYPGVSIITGTYYNGSGGEGYWNQEVIDSQGRAVKKKSYKKETLLSENHTVYDNKNNKIALISIYDINRPNQSDTAWTCSYEYQNGEIISQTTQNRSGSSTTIKLQSVEGDSAYTYIETTSHNRPNSRVSGQNKKEHRIIKTENGLIKEWTETDLSNGDKLIKTFTYYSNGQLQRRMIKRVPEPELKTVYLGGPGGDDETWEYKYDKAGRVRTSFKLVNGKKYKIAKYDYDL
ncbi:MAG: hypothetical protein KDD99_29550 [Bacteroidetes bacterium]|nr:hypothetical protein [Bacteroidota bacterium]